jgi:uncharacterized damage-inducible protein DinB
MEPELESPFVVKSVPGYAPVIGHLVTMLAYARRTTLKAVEGLSVSQLDHMPDEEANSIGMLLEHIAGVEEWYQEGTFGLEFRGEALARRELEDELNHRGQIRLIRKRLTR